MLAEESQDFSVRPSHEQKNVDVTIASGASGFNEGPMDGDDPSPPKPMLDVDPDIDPTPAHEQTSDMRIDAIILAGVRERSARDYAALVMKL